MLKDFLFQLKEKIDAIKLLIDESKFCNLCNKYLLEDCYICIEDNLRYELCYECFHKKFKNKFKLGDIVSINFRKLKRNYFCIDSREEISYKLGNTVWHIEPYTPKENEKDFIKEYKNVKILDIFFKKSIGVLYLLDVMQGEPIEEKFIHK